MSVRKIPFWKMNGAGNDFVLLDRSETKIRVTPTVAKTLLHRQFGAGGDQLVVLNPGRSGQNPKLEFFNMDGSKAEMCGNGTRATAFYLREFKGVRKDFEFETASRNVGVRFDGKKIIVDMGFPIWPGPRIPVKSKGEVLDFPFKVDGQKFQISCVSMGNPHCVIYVKDVVKFPVKEWGPLIEHHPFFPRRVNVEFVQIVNPRSVKVRVWERGSGETLACGSGACAVGAVGDRLNKTAPALRQQWPGGVLETRISSEGRVTLTGPAEVTYRGSFLV